MALRQLVLKLDAAPTSHQVVLTFQTRCNINIAIDYNDQNYFASSALDQPNVLIWDRRAVSRTAASPYYLEAVDSEDVLWGSALEIKRAVNPNTTVRNLRYNRDNRGFLAVLGWDGELAMFRTSKEWTDPEEIGLTAATTPELLEISFNHKLERAGEKKPEEQIVSFDWFSLGTATESARLLTLRANSKHGVMIMPEVEQSTPFEFDGFTDGKQYVESFHGPYSDVFQVIKASLAKHVVPLQLSIRSIMPKRLAVKPILWVNLWIHQVVQDPALSHSMILLALKVLME